MPRPSRGEAYIKHPGAFRHAFFSFPWLSLPGPAVPSETDFRARIGDVTRENAAVWPLLRYANPMTAALLQPPRRRELVLAPNLLSLARVPLAALFAFEVRSSSAPVTPWLALATLGCAAVTDVADGYWARKLHQETAVGRIVDPTADKIFFATAAIALVAAGKLSPAALVLLGTREISQLGLAIVLATRGTLLRASAATPSSPAGKLTTVLQTAAIAAALVWPEARRAIAAAAAISGLVAGVEYWTAGITCASSRSCGRARPGPDSRTETGDRAQAAK